MPNEWMQPPGGENLPALGRVIDKTEPNNDLRWDHPFGFDYTWNVAIDDGRYRPLLNPATLVGSLNCSELAEQDACNARARALEETARDPKGVLHTEVEGGAPDNPSDEGLLPRSYRPIPGDVVYMRGHRIADCGHRPYGAEMHPPTLVVAARIWPEDGSIKTTLIATPYLTTQTYEIGKDFPTAVAAAMEAAAASPVGIPTGLPIIAEASSRPFSVPIIAKYSVAVPGVPHRTATLNLHYHFVTRPGVTVLPNPVSGSRVDVEIRMDPTAYQPFSVPNCHRETFGLETFDEQKGLPHGTIRGAVNGIAALLFGLPGGALIATPTVVGTLNLGMQVAVCVVPNSVPRAPDTINDNAVVIDTSQPYPVYGWLSYD